MKLEVLRQFRPRSSCWTRSGEQFISPFHQRGTKTAIGTLVGKNGRLPFKVCHSPLPSFFVISFAQQALRKPFCAGTATAVVVAVFVNRGWPAVGYEIRRKSSSGGQRI